MTTKLAPGCEFFRLNGNKAIMAKPKMAIKLRYSRGSNGSWINHPSEGDKMLDVSFL